MIWIGSEYISFIIPVSEVTKVVKRIDEYLLIPHLLSPALRNSLFDSQEPVLRCVAEDGRYRTRPHPPCLSSHWNAEMFIVADAVMVRVSPSNNS